MDSSAFEYLLVICKIHLMTPLGLAEFPCVWDVHPMRFAQITSFLFRPFIACMVFFGLRGHLSGIRHGLFSLQFRAQQLKLGASHQPMHIDHVFQAQRLSK